MKLHLLCLFLSLLTFNVAVAESESISGVIHYDQKAEGTLLIFIRYFEGAKTNPVAVKMFENPKFPLKFSLSKENAITPGMPFKGPFRVIAKLTPAGGGWEKSKIFAKGTTPSDKPVELGAQDILITLK